jgi:predicted AlkP superfamily phosphohydrolase/phosphomutase
MPADTHAGGKVPVCKRALPSRLTAALLLGVLLLLAPVRADAYVGPGAGIAFVSSFLVVLTTFFLTLLTLLTWPVRTVLRTIRGKRALAKSRTEKVIIVGFDGMDPELTDKFMAKGLLPNLSRLRESGSYSRLETTLPAESPVAWSSFQTGCNPGRHRVFDFLIPNRKSYLPELCSARIEAPRRNLTLGKYRIPLSRPSIRFERKSQSFWKILGEHGVFSTVVRVPISFPPEKFKGLLLSAMSTPDLRGSQGTFSYYTTDAEERAKYTGGIQILVERNGGLVRSYISGPENPFLKEHTEMRIPFSVHPGKNGTDAQLVLDRKRYPLKLREYTSWIPLRFRTGLGPSVHGICRLRLMEVSPHFRLYITPISIDPGKPAMPISNPLTYSMYLARTIGPFCTHGLAEDTWGLNEGVLDEEAFLEQAYMIHQEREHMLFDAVEKTNRGAVACVFDITDRVQHMFWRYLEEDHPANAGKDPAKYRDVIATMYEKMDGLVGRVMEKIRDKDVLIVMSDHGFTSFRRGVNLNTWLHQNGYLALTGSPSGAEWFHDVDWSGSRAYAVGLGGVYLNLKGREARGIVLPGTEEKALKQELIGRLRGLRDEERGAVAIDEVYDTHETYKGPYVQDGPDLIAGFSRGYRISWTSATGAVTERVFEDNVKAWSGDHCINPTEVPGVFFCNRKVDEGRANIMDVGPTVLDLFGVQVPTYCDGKSLMPARAE